MQLHIIAPTFDAEIVGGAGVALVELTSRFLRDWPDTKVYLNERTAALFPEWQHAIVPVRCGSMRKSLQKTFAVAKLELLGFARYPREGVCWFPFGPMMPLWFRGQGVSTIHDTLEKDMPARLPISERVFRRVLLPRTVNAVAVATDSRFSAQRIKHHYGVQARVIRLGTPLMPAPSDACAPAQPYVFYPANAFPHKNHRFLLDLWRQTPELSAISIVFTLGSGLGGLAQHIAKARRAGINVIVTGHVSRAEISGLYRNALCAVLPSLYEGFGLPMQEALLCQCPVLANASCDTLHETVTADYPFFLPLDGASWAETILAFTHNVPSNLSQYLVRRTWDDCAKDYVEFLTDVIRRARSTSR